MQIQNILVTALAAATSASADGQADPAADAKATYVTFYKHVNFGGTPFPVEALNRCVRLSQPLYHQASSVKFHANNISCSLFGGAICNKMVYQGMRSSVADLHKLEIGDKVGSVFCVKV